MHKWLRALLCAYQSNCHLLAKNLLSYRLTSHSVISERGRGRDKQQCH